jgi:hypothetical protein
VAADLKGLRRPRKIGARAFGLGLGNGIKMGGKERPLQGVTAHDDSAPS